MIRVRSLISFTLILSIALQAPLADLFAKAGDARTAASSGPRICETLVKGLDTSTPKDWGHLPPSLIPLVIANVSLLLGVESVRALAGWEGAFSPQFFVNTPLDMTMTAVAHTIAIGRAPHWLKNLTSGKLGYVARATTNTLLNTFLILTFWKAAAVAQGKVITADEAAGALGLCTAFYFCIQYVKNKIFIKLPRELDARLLKKIETEMGPEFAHLVERARTRTEEIEVPQEDVELRFISAVDALILKIPFEDKVAQGSIEALRDFARSIQRESNESRKESLRRKLIWKSLEHIAAHPETKPELGAALSVGAPLTDDQSLALHQKLKDRFWRNRILVDAGVVGDQSIGVVLAGGILLRGLTQAALAH